MPSTKSGKISPAERLIVWQVCVFALCATWMFGGEIYWARLPLRVIGTIGACLTVWLILTHREKQRKYLLWLLPFLGLNGLVILSSFNPSFIEFTYWGEKSTRSIDHQKFLPSSATPSISLYTLWLYDGIFLSAFNILIGIKKRSVIRIISLALVINGGVLAVFGTIQKLTGSEIWFGAETSPNSSFFATFIYHNHWGAYALITSALGLGLAAYYLTHARHGNIWRTPALVLCIPVLLLAASIPLSTSRSSTLTELILLFIAFGYVVRFTWRRNRESRTGRLSAITSLSLVSLLAIGAIYVLAKPIISQRLTDTMSQWKKENHYAFDKSDQVFYFDSRMTLYRDTMDMALDKPWLGWGLGSYERVFLRYNSQAKVGPKWKQHYVDAHSDWLQSFAEIGIIGVLLLIGIAAPIIVSSYRFWFKDASIGFPIVGAFLLIGYGIIEFPFKNTAVLISFWVIFISSCRYATISAANRKA